MKFFIAVVILVVAFIAFATREVPTQYRIVTDGQEFAIEKKVRLGWQRETDLIDGFGAIPFKSYKTRLEAEEAITHYQKKETKGDWRPIQ